VRRHLTCEEAVAEARVLYGRGFRHVLLVASDFPKLTSPAYFAEIIRAIRALGMSVAVEIASQPTTSYAELADAGACGVILYQETYDDWLYATYHLRGPKASYPWRLESHDRVADAGIDWLGLGILLGLGDPWLDLASLVCHGRYLAARYPQTQLSFSLPRLHDVPEGFTPQYAIDDELFVAFYCLLRVEFPTAELVLSTREPAALRNRLARICITQMSAGSSTAPGGYQVEDCSLAGGEQFAIADERSPSEVADWLELQGFDVRWKRGA
jgi:2-iminoacetate synthase